VPPHPPSPAPAFDQSDLQQSPPPPERLPEVLPADPLPLLKAWFDEAVARRVQPNPSAMTLATIDPDGRLSARIVLCKEIHVTEGYVVFYTNYTSRKGLETNPAVALVMHWDALERQVRIQGVAMRSPEAENDAYFATRPWASRIGAWASEQSCPLGSRAEMFERVNQTMRRFGLDPDNPPPDEALVAIPRPPHWGGYRVYIERLELWTAGAGRVHDRAVWERPPPLQPAGPARYTVAEGGVWSAPKRLQP
jgi:pyridoxamine 5'-phosphate oxidase